ncbi:MAG: hypothetical protein K9J37_04525 [Saprospiraceae bacterium]|nr:hypothetical protein [Saprospiraceae bacterium]MCF8249151.1 hypothetical protein [Saprospiraceae bacterium]MCF8278907.1 hypothetical protein [Bacteroidales bacterium]MCF8311280.1 hypothetical protein [Saprospiraceae bacterium]MCF8440156.1 hypothetical protein [Saprospiraceae bacterium]
MKILLKSSMLFLLLAFGCCKTTDDEPVETPYYVGTAKWELANDISNGLASAIDSWNVPADYYNVSFYRNFTGQNFYFRGLKLDLGKQLLTINAPPADNIPSADFYHANGDAIYDIYHLIELDSVENYFEITSIDFVNQAVEGKFQAAFAVDTNFIASNPAGDPDTVIFRNGTFKTLIR